MDKRSRRIDALNVKDNVYYWVKCVIEDPEFIEFSNTIKRDIQGWYVDNNKGMFSYDPKFLERDNVPKEMIDKIAATAEKFRLNRDYYISYLDGSIVDVLNPLQVGAKVENGQIVLEMDRRITQVSFRELWPMVEMAKEKLIGKENLKKKNRGTPNYKLIYYITKALDKGYDFKDVYKMYDNGELPGYPHKVKERIYTLEELRGFFRRYRIYKT